MKTRTLASIFILVLAVWIGIGSCATRRKAISEEDFMETWSGTWVNTDSKEEQKIVNHPDGTREVFGTLTSTIVSCTYKYTILEQWLDSKGTIWYRGHFETLPPCDTTGYEMGNISDSGNTLEILWASEDYPIEEWEPDNFAYNYLIYYRQE